MQRKCNNAGMVGAAMPTFKRLGESELAGLDDDALIAYAVRPRAAGVIHYDATTT